MRSTAVAIALALGIALASGCGKGPAPTAADDAEIKKMLDDWHDAAARADETRYFEHFAPNAVFLGTDATERWDLAAFRTYAHPHFAKGKAWAFKSVRRSVSIDPGGAIAWFDEDLATQNLGPCRGSGVVVREGGRGPWQIAQYNLTITVPNQRFPEVKKLLDSPQPPVK